MSRRVSADGPAALARGESKGPPQGPFLSSRPPARRDVVVIGASAGGVEALTRLFSALPGDLAAAIAVTLHRSAGGPSILARVVGRHSPLPVIEATNGQRFERGHVYVAPPDHHLLVGRDRLWLDRGPKHHHVRPAIDPMFMTAAQTYRDRVIGVLLTGNLSDGVSGLVEIENQGGLTLVQDPYEARSPSMPRNALRHDHVDLVVQLDALPAVLELLLAGRTPRAAADIPGARAPFVEEVLGP